MNIVSELQKLDELRKAGILTEQEFQRAKKRLIDGLPAAVSSTTKGNHDDTEIQVKIARLDGDWQVEREKFLVSGGQGHRSHKHVPSVFYGSVHLLTTCILITGGFAALVLASLDSHIHVTPGWWLLALVLIPLLLWGALDRFRKALGYQEAEMNYQVKRDDLVRRAAQKRK